MTELKSFGSPPAAVVNVTAAVMVLLSNKAGKIPKDRSWKAAKVVMGKVGISICNPIPKCGKTNFEWYVLFTYLTDIIDLLVDANCSLLT